LLEKKTRPLEEGSPERIAEENAIQELRNMPENVFAIGNFISTNKFDGWVKEQLSGLSSNVKYVHNKFMLIDPLGDDPIVITGSANFSNASTNQNDENMLVIRGNKRVADIYFGEFMRLFTHYTFRESLTFRKRNAPKPLKTNESEIKWWDDYFKNTPRFHLKKFFSETKI
jgi:phosphatidylserine/phosphatidylglycerophosphate/cardiolipin synthase-like enzyme